MSNINKSLHVILLLLVSIAANAQQPVSLKQLLIQVDKSAPTLITDSSAIGIRQAQAAEVRNNWLPNLRLSYQADLGTNNNVAGPYFGFGIIPSDSRGVRTESNTTAVSANVGVAALDWEIYNFGAYGAQNRVAQSNIQVEQNNFAHSKYQLEAYTISNYLLLTSLQDYLKIQAYSLLRKTGIPL